MAIPRGYKRGSGGFLQPIGRVPSGTTSGPGHGVFEGMTREDFGRTRGQKAADAKVLASFKRAQKAHEGVMAGIAKAETDKFTRINEALNKSKESDPKDKLGNTVPSKQTQYLEAQLLNILGQASQKGRQTATPGAAGVTPEQERRFVEEGPYIPGAPGTRGLLQAPAPAPMPELQPAFRTPIKGTKMLHSMGEVTLTGETRTGPNGEQEVEATMGDKTGWVPMKSLNPIEPADTEGLAQLRQYYKTPTEDFQPF